MSLSQSFGLTLNRGLKDLAAVKLLFMSITALASGASLAAATTAGVAVVLDVITALLEGAAKGNEELSPDKTCGSIFRLPAVYAML